MRDSARILVVEDEILLAEALSDLLREEGFELAGPVGTLQDALDQVQGSSIDAALLDIRLFHEQGYPVAYELQAKRIPFVFLTSHARCDLPPDLQSHLLIEKPFDVPTLLQCVRAMVAVPV
jgi:DNA-binding response OmpR family regulator